MPPTEGRRLRRWRGSRRQGGRCGTAWLEADVAHEDQRHEERHYQQAGAYQVGHGQVDLSQEPTGQRAKSIEMFTKMPVRANTWSLLPVCPLASSASTIQASTAPVWQVKPNPSTEAR